MCLARVSFTFFLSLRKLAICSAPVIVETRAAYHATTEAEIVSVKCGWSIGWSHILHQRAAIETAYEGRLLLRFPPRPGRGERPARLQKAR